MEVSSHNASHYLAYIAYMPSFVDMFVSGIFSTAKSPQQCSTNHPVVVICIIGIVYAIVDRCKHFLLL